MMSQVCIVLTQRQHLRTWIYQGHLNTLAEHFEISLFVPSSLSEVRIQNPRVKVVSWDFVKEPFWERISQYLLLISHRSNKTFAEKIRKLILDEQKIHSKSKLIFAYFKSIRRKPLLYLLHVPLFFRCFDFLYQRHLLKKVVTNIPPSEIYLVIVSVSDYTTNLVLASLQLNESHVIQIMDNWDNISSKLCPSYLPKKIVVWSEQTRKHALEIHAIDSEKVIILGSPRFPNSKIVSNLIGSRQRETTKLSRKVRIFYAGFFSECNSIESVSELFKSIERNLPQFEFEFLYRPHPLNIGQNIEDSDSTWGVSQMSIHNPFIDARNTSGWPINSDTFYAEMINCDIVIGTPSTFLLEEILFRVNLILDNRDCTEHYNSARRYFSKSAHFEEIISSDYVRRIDSTEVSAKKVLEALERVVELPSELVNYLVYNDEKDYVQRLVEFVNLELSKIKK